MVKRRDWTIGCEDLGVEFVRVDQDYVYCTKDGFTFKVGRHSWPVRSLQTRHCTDPTEYFKFEIRQLHGDLYDLSETIFNGYDKPVTASCKIHGKFTTLARNLKEKKDCPRCGRDRSANAKYLDNAEFIRRSVLKLGDIYDYSLVDYKDSETKVKVICKEHGVFEVIPESHIQGRGCVTCSLLSASRKMSKDPQIALDDLIKVHGDRYDYSLFRYNGDKTKLEIICRKHGIFLQAYSNHRSGQGCPQCAKDFNPRFKDGFIRSSIRNSYASLYLIECYNDYERFSKIGITTKKLSERFPTDFTMPYTYDLVHLFESDGGTVWELEKLLHQEYRDIQYLPKMAFGGRYECFSKIDADEYIKLLAIIA